MKTSILSKRISAYLIDILFLFVIINLITDIKFINPYYDKYIESYEQYSELIENYNNEEINEEEFNELYNINYYEVSKYSIAYNVVIVLSIILYFVVFQKFNNGQTLGKKFLKIKVVENNTEENASLLKYFLRSLPIYFIYIGGILPLIINSILVFVLNENNYMFISTIISYGFLILSIVTLVMLNVRKDERGIHDLLANTKVIYMEK